MEEAQRRSRWFNQEVQTTCKNLGDDWCRYLSGFEFEVQPGVLQKRTTGEISVEDKRRNVHPVKYYSGIARAIKTEIDSLK